MGIVRRIKQAYNPTLNSMNSYFKASREINNILKYVKNNMRNGSWKRWKIHKYQIKEWKTAKTLSLYFPDDIYNDIIILIRFI